MMMQWRQFTIEFKEAERQVSLCLDTSVLPHGILWAADQPSLSPLSQFT